MQPALLAVVSVVRTLIPCLAICTRIMRTGVHTRVCLHLSTLCIAYTHARVHSSAIDFWKQAEINLSKLGVTVTDLSFAMDGDDSAIFNDDDDIGECTFQFAPYLCSLPPTHFSRTLCPSLTLPPPPLPLCSTYLPAYPRALIGLLGLMRRAAVRHSTTKGMHA